jgi:hypothetical protein
VYDILALRSGAGYWWMEWDGMGLGAMRREELINLATIVCGVSGNINYEF